MARKRSDGKKMATENGEMGDVSGTKKPNGKLKMILEGRNLNLKVRIFSSMKSTTLMQPIDN